jgi:putative transposase
MSGPPARFIEVSARQRAALELIERASSTSQQLAERCRVVLMAAEGESNDGIAQALGVDRQLVRRWRNRWADGRARLTAAEDENATEKDLRALIVGLLADEARSGGPTTFTPEQVAAIIALWPASHLATVASRYSIGLRQS